MEALVFEELRQTAKSRFAELIMMDESKEFAEKMVELTDAQAEMAVYKHLNDYMKKYAQKLQRNLNDISLKLSKMDKKGVRSNDYGLLYAKSHVLKCQIQHARTLELEFLKRAMDICDNCDNPLKEAQELYKRLTTMM